MFYSLCVSKLLLESLHKIIALPLFYNIRILAYLELVVFRTPGWE